MPLRIILEAVAVGAGTLSVILAFAQVEVQQLPRMILWLAAIILLIAVVGETYDLLRVTQARQ